VRLWVDCALMESGKPGAPQCPALGRQIVPGNGKPTGRRDGWVVHNVEDLGDHGRP